MAGPTGITAETTGGGAFSTDSGIASGTGSAATTQPQSTGSVAGAPSSFESTHGAKVAAFRAPRKEIYTYKAPWNVYGLNWSARPDKPFRLATGSFIEEYRNKLQIVQMNESSQEFEKIAEDDHQYPITRLMWMPPRAGPSPDLLATSADYLRIWEVGGDNSLRRKCLLANVRQSKGQEYCAPLTSFDWNEADPTLIGTSSIDTTCTIWNIETQQAKTQLIAHDKEVFDLGFMTRTADIFASVGADGSMRMFDLRNLEHSTIMYETADNSPLLRLAWNKQDQNYVAVVGLDSDRVIILDVRVPSVAVTELVGHMGAVNSVAWAPHSAHHICTTSDDHQALVWDVHSMGAGGPPSEPMLSYRADAEINSLSWSSQHTDWVAVGFGDTVQALHV